MIQQTEVLVIGSGFGAAAPALRLAERGVPVLMIEKGNHIIPARDFRQTSDPQYLTNYLKTCSGDNVSFIFAEGYGGGSGFYEMVSLRAPAAAFEQHDESGARLWPKSLCRSALDPYYERAEAMLNVAQIAPEDVPKTGRVFSMMMRNLGYSCDRARYALRNCRGSGYCISGCIFGAKQSLHINYLPQSENMGMTVICNTEAMTVRPADGGYEVFCRDTLTDSEFVVKCRLLILAGGTVGTAALLLRSRKYLPAVSNQAGKKYLLEWRRESNRIIAGYIAGSGYLPRTLTCRNGEL